MLIEEDTKIENNNQDQYMNGILMALENIKFQRGSTNGNSRFNIQNKNQNKNNNTESYSPRIHRKARRMVGMLFHWRRKIVNI